MTQNSRETIQRAIGIIEGASYTASTRIADALVTAMELLDSVLDKEGESNERE